MGWWSTGSSAPAPVPLCARRCRWREARAPTGLAGRVGSARCSASCTRWVPARARSMGALALGPRPRCDASSARAGSRSTASSAPTPHGGWPATTSRRRCRRGGPAETPPAQRPPIPATIAERRGTPTDSTDPVGIAVLVAVAVIALALLLVGGAQLAQAPSARRPRWGPDRGADRGRGRAGAGPAAGPRLGGGAATQTRAPARAEAAAQGWGPQWSDRPGRPGRNRGRPTAAAGRRSAAEGAGAGLRQRAG